MGADRRTNLNWQLFLTKWPRRICSKQAVTKINGKVVGDMPMVEGEANGRKRKGLMMATSLVCRIKLAPKIRGVYEEVKAFYWEGFKR